MKRTKITISDHALLRYIERVHDVDIEAIRQIVADELEPLHVAGVPRQVIRIGKFLYLLHHSNVVTVMVKKREYSPLMKDVRNDR